MCVGICYKTAERLIITHFAEPKASLPVQTKSQKIELISWGRRRREPGKLPLGGWITLPAIKQGQWDYYFPKAIKIPVLKFLEQDIEGQLRWFDVTAGHWIQGAILKDNDEIRAYIVIITPEELNQPYQRWPRIINKL